MVFFSGNNHFTIFVEVVNAYKVQTVCIFFRNCLISALLQLAAVAYIIIGIVNFDKTCAHPDISIFIYVIYSVGSGKQPLLSYLAHKHTVIAEIKDIFLERCAVTKNLYAICEISVVSEIIGLAANFMKRHISRVTRHIIARTVIIACAFIICMPCAICHTSFVKLIRHAIDCIFTGYSSLSIRAEVVPVFTDLHPAAGKHAYFGIIPLTFDLNESGIFALILTVVAEVIVNTVNCIDTGHFLAVYIVVIAVPAVSYYNTVNIGLAVCPYTVEQSVTAGALEHAGNESVAMSRCGNGRAPVNNGVADFAERSARVACFRASRRLVGNSVGGMDMSAVPGIVVRFAFGGGNHILRHLVHLGVDLRTFTGECIGRTVDKCNDTAVDLHADVDGPEFLHALELSIGICCAAFFSTACIGITHFEFPCADRQRSKGSFADLCIFTCACNCDRCDVFIVLNAVFSCESGSDCHMVKFPLAHIVEVDINSNRLNLFDIRSNDIGIPYRAEKDLIKRRIMRYNLDCRFARVCLNIDRADHRSIVALIIAD